MEEDNVKLKADDGQLAGGVSAGGVGFGVGGGNQKPGNSDVAGDSSVGIGLNDEQNLQNGQGLQGGQNSQKNNGDEEEAINNEMRGVGQKVVSLKGVHTESELERQQRLDEMKKRAVALGKTEAEIKKEQELEEMKKRAVSLKDGQRLSVSGSQAMVNSVSDQSISGQDKELREVGALKTPHPPFREKGDGSLYPASAGPGTGGEKGKSTPNPSQASGGELGKARTIITPEGRLVEMDAGEKLSGGQKVVNLKEAVEESGIDELSEKKNVKNVVDLGSAKSTTNPSLVHGSQFTVHSKFDKIDEEKKDNLERWEEQKVDLSTLSSEERLDLQATPALASVHRKMDDDLNGEVADWFDKYNKLPVNIKLGLGDRQGVQQAIKDLANKFGVMTEEGLGEISRIVRDVYVNLIGESEIKNRAINNLKIANGKIDDFLREVAKIVSLVREVGNKKTDEYFRKLSVEEILENYPKLAEQEVTTGDIFDKKQQKYVAPTLKNWIDDYINNAGSDKHTSLERAKYLEESYNTKHLEEDDRQAVDMLAKSYDTGSKLLVDSQDDVIYWRLHTDESELGINSDKSKRVINNFKIEEAQKVDVDREEQNREAENNLEKSGKSSIMEEKKRVGEDEKGDVLDLSTELGNNKNLGS